MKTIDKGIRATNYLVDMTIILTIYIVILLFYYSAIEMLYVYYLLKFLYYLIMESIFRQTLGKMITKTTVVKKDGRPANSLNILIRSTMRLIPIDTISYLLGTERGFHDVLSSTKLIRK